MHGIIETLKTLEDAVGVENLEIEGNILRVFNTEAAQAAAKIAKALADASPGNEDIKQLAIIDSENTMHFYQGRVMTLTMGSLD